MHLTTGQSLKCSCSTAIGNPKRFSDTLESLGFEVILHAYDDHQVMTMSDLTFEDDYPVIITAKDAINPVVELKHFWVLMLKLRFQSNLLKTFCRMSI